MRIDGSPRHEIIKYLGTYENAVAQISRLRIESVKKQAYLTRLAKLEGLLDVGEVPLPEKAYQCIVLDPPWFYKLRTGDNTQLNPIPYKPMKLIEIKKLPIPELSIHTGCVLWLWFTNNHLIEAAQCIQEWEFELKTVLTWEKITKKGTPHIGTGNWLRNVTEHCILATKGKIKAFSNTKTLINQSTILRASCREYNRKPDEFYNLVETLCAGMTKLEMFARQSREGWDSWGNETRMFDEIEFE
ncbi:MT-A70 family methyltransferase [Mastigocoleus sp. MO_188.B34]|uniref:MT-A70 family methyltransferase n=1 Tax=Mastigocoleus sp. MO_188.B34 TaxID=3036635 RepID=UPI00260B58BD|nr:MT-A70 family methyltransferase [Mastigocoleus sp. MO_188.B34]MDJ0697535.1 MT-A70 family methyltransferase [Mastigocoleus sp. MO_188.B34]